MKTSIDRESFLDCARKVQSLAGALPFGKPEREQRRGRPTDSRRAHALHYSRRISSSILSL